MTQMNMCACFSDRTNERCLCRSLFAVQHITRRAAGSNRGKHASIGMDGEATAKPMNHPIVNVSCRIVQTDDDVNTQSSEAKFSFLTVTAQFSVERR